jgi:predicted alpha/beta hydrolase family esterase
MGDYISESGSGVYRAGENHAALLPWNYDGDRTPILYGHAYGASALSILTGAAYWTAFPTRLRLPLVAGDLGGASLFGNPTAVSAVDDLRTFAQKQTAPNIGGKSGDVLLFGGSMGAQTLLNWTRQHLTDVAAILAVIGVPDVEAARANNRNGIAAAIEAAYTDNAGWQAARPTSNPIEYAADLAAIPCMWWYSTNDPYYTVAEVNALAAAWGANLELHSLGAVGHTFGGLDVDACVEFIAAHTP